MSRAADCTEPQGGLGLKEHLWWGSSRRQPVHMYPVCRRARLGWGGSRLRCNEIRRRSGARLAGVGSGSWSEQVYHRGMPHLREASECVEAASMTKRALVLSQCEG